MSEPDRDVERTNRRVRPWILGLWMVVVVGYGGFTLTRNSGWSIVFSLLMVVGGLIVIVVVIRELLKHRRGHR
ncbi:hypothetical protein AB2L27_17160 [Kineococcus sp. LSe6-4]|uniref:DUF2631 domain-containing protein n=1 Tax=Kineococcus halophytocola TaxID=3234027 RepID=A0ABV4H7W5_9ACTN